MSRYISEELRRLVSARAGDICEYCLIDSADTYYGSELDHIIGVKHGGATTADNLAQACQPCNRDKGSDLGSIYWPTGQLVRFFNPRTDHWANHFALSGALLEPLTELGEVTARLLGFNDKRRVEERQGLIELGSYPPPAALELMRKKEPC